MLIFQRQHTYIYKIPNIHVQGWVTCLRWSPKDNRDSSTETSSDLPPPGSAEAEEPGLPVGQRDFFFRAALKGHVA